jgi:hypothetical protein
MGNIHSSAGPHPPREFDETVLGSPLAAAALAAASIVAHVGGDAFPVEVIVDAGAEPCKVVRDGRSD